MRAFSIAGKTVKELLREPKSLAIVLGLPVVFMAIFGLAFGQEESNATFEVAVASEDEPVDLSEFRLGARTANGTRESPEATLAARSAVARELGARPDLAASFTGVLANMTYPSGEPVFRVTRAATREDAEGLVRSGDAQALLVLPAGFGRALVASAFESRTGELGLVLLAPSPAPGADVTIAGDPASVGFNVANGILSGALAEFAGAFAPRAGGQVGSHVESVVSSRVTTFEYIAPGLMVFAVLNLAPQAAAILARESEQRTLERLRLTRMRGVDLLSGVALAEMAVAVVSVALMFAAAYAFGFRSEGNVLVAVVVALITALAVLGVGMIISAFATKQQDAANLGVVFSVPASFLSGAFFPIPPVILFETSRRAFQLYDLLPTTHATRALRNVLTTGGGFADVQFEIVAMLVLSAIYFAVGAALYSRRRLRAV